MSLSSIRTTGAPGVVSTIGLPHPMPVWLHLEIKNQGRNPNKIWLLRFGESGGIFLKF